MSASGRTTWILQSRNDADSPWQRCRGYKTEDGAMNALRNATTTAPFRVVTGNADGTLTIHASRN